MTKPRVYGRRVTTLPLPGDADDVMVEALRRAIRRDNGLNIDEWRARATAQSCAYLSAKYQFHHCTWSNPCYDCEGLL